MRFGPKFDTCRRAGSWEALLKSSALTWSVGVLALVLGCLLIAERSVLAGLRRERDQLAHLLSDRESGRLDAAKHDCASRSVNLFRTLGFSDNPAQKNSGMHTEEFVDHYSKRLGRCLIDITITDAASANGQARETISKNIYDADERRTFGEYYWISSDTKKYWEQKPFQCHMTPPDKDEGFCKSTGEWENFEQELMNS